MVSNIMTKYPFPFLKWAGGKQQLISIFIHYFPKTYNKYIEPFVGGGAVFFHLRPQKAILMDINSELINCYNVIKNDYKKLIGKLKNHKQKHNKQYYYKVRAWDREQNWELHFEDIERASRFIYLNKTCYNGLYRVNKKGEFNVPFGRYKNPRIFDEWNLKICSKFLQQTVLYCDDFTRCLEFAEKDDLIYLDPPYVPISPTANFVEYSEKGFSFEDQIRLFYMFLELDKHGCKLMLSNSYSKSIIELYQPYGYKILEITANRKISSNPKKRNNVKEVLILNY